MVLRSHLFLATVLGASCSRPLVADAPPQPEATGGFATPALRVARVPRAVASWRRADDPPALPSEPVDAEATAATDVLLEEETPTLLFVLRVPAGSRRAMTLSSLELLVTHRQSGAVVSVTLPEVSPGVVVGGDTWVQVADFDFDGADDFAIHAGNEGPYGSPTYSFFLQRPRTGTFEPSPALDALSATSLAGLTVDAERKRLLVSSKSGCCIHWSQEHRMRNGKPELMSSDMVDDASHPDQCVHTTRERNARGLLVVKTEPCDIE